MTRWSKVRAVATFELLTIVRSKGYLIATFGMPVFLLAYGGVIAMIGYFADKREKTEVVVYGVLDDAGVLNLTGDVEAAAVPVPPEVRLALEQTGRADVLSGPMALFQNFVFRPVASQDEAGAALRAKKI